jgi:protein-tyrosine kinase
MQAVGRAKPFDTVDVGQRGAMGSSSPGQPRLPSSAPDFASVPPLSETLVPLNQIALDAKTLEAGRIVSHDALDRRGKAFDMLRTQVLQSMDAKGWKFLGVTSPTAGCGKTLTAINLALSIARQRPALLVDMDLQKPQVARRLGVGCDAGLLGVLEGRTTLTEAMFQAHIGKHQIMVLPTEAETLSSSEWMVSAAMLALMQKVRRDPRASLVIFDMPPVLLSDDVIAILPQMDCVLQVVAVGTTTVSEIEECNRYLKAANVVRIVVNKLPEWNKRYY